MNSELVEEVKTANITGTMVAYYFICHRKLWLFAKGLNLENISGNPDVIKGRVLHESRFKRENHKEITFDTVKIDFLHYDGQVYVHEVKKSKKFEEAHTWQLKYYIYLLQNKGVNCSSGVIHYPASMRKEEVHFSTQDRELLLQAMAGIKGILNSPLPKRKTGRKMCSRCAYFDFCYV
ncbi:CRISPR-associated protein Cas4 [Moorella sp. E308F]|uniref:CRISPR-associated protein Cas4 n=1 Tax=Moorella sp. E308F TaxID=2572682 RepID=UPI0010FFB835|nr:CRISPR-associated protein Cas4 [Moorella sp. E308F]GEA15004.1 CRISPR-associated protein Cas4 [Moorella sp. E308F]